MEKRAITWTRSYFQVIFTAGLTVAFCVGQDILKHSTDTDVEQRDPARTLNLCSGILSFFKDKMPDAGSSAVVFDVLKEECLRDKASGAGPSNTTTTEAPNNLATPSEPSDPSAQNINQAYTAAFDALSQNSINLHPSMDQFAPNYAIDTQDFGFGLTDDLMTQLEAGLGEYAWGSIPMDGNFWDQVSFNY
jgi:hypothetical protein